MIEGLGKSRRDGGTLREKRRTGQGLRGVDTRSFGGQYKMWVLGRKLRLRLEREGPVLVLGLGVTQRAPLGHGCRSFQMSSCPGFCDTQPWE